VKARRADLVHFAIDSRNGQILEEERMKQGVPIESGSMDVEHPDSEGSTAPLSPKKRRRLPLFVKLLLAIATLAGLVTFVVIQRSSNMYWYVSQPIDHDGRRVHILLPVGWTPSDSEYFPGRWNKDTNNSGLRLTITMGEEMPKLTWLQRIMKMLHMTPPNEPYGVIVLQIDRDETGRWNDPNRSDASETHDIQLSGNGVIGRACITRRSIPIRGTDKDATVEYTSVYVISGVPISKQEWSDTATPICNSMYVK
jgi:hypothetical protein